MRPSYPEDEASYEQLRNHGIPEEAVIFGWVVCNEKEGRYYTATPRMSVGFLCWDMGTTTEQYEARPFQIRKDAEQLAGVMPGYEVQLMIAVYLDTAVVIREAEIAGYKQLHSIP